MGHRWRALVAIPTLALGAASCHTDESTSADDPPAIPVERVVPVLPAPTTTAAPATPANSALGAPPAASVAPPITAPPAPTTTVTAPPTTAPPASATAPPTTTVPTTTLPPPPPPPPPSPAPGGAPWDLRGASASVALPVGRLGPRTATAIDPATVPGISFAGGVWTMGRDWDESVEGGYLDFGAAALRPDGHTVLGFRIEVPDGLGSGHVIDGGGEVGFFEITNPDRHSHNSYLRHSLVAHHYIARGVVGDAIKVGKGFAHHHDAYIDMDVRPGGPDDKHYDGAQIFNQGAARLERIVIEWNNAGTIANTTGAVFTQQDATLVMRDVVVLNPGGTWQPVRLSGTGAHDVARLQLIGTRAPNNNDPTKLAPTAAVKITNGSPTFTLHNGVDGVDDWLIE